MVTRLTPHFTLEEFTRSSVSYPNIPRGPMRERLWHTAMEMETVRAMLGHQPVHITSAYRCPEVNAAVGGVEDSDHVFGYAVDFYLKGATPWEIVDTLDKSDLFFAQLINEHEKGIVHISFNPLNPLREVLTQFGSTWRPGNHAPGD